MNLHSRWNRFFKNDEAQLKKFSLLMSNSDMFRETLGKLIKTMEKETEQSISYDLENWPYRRADKDGYQRALRDICKIIGVDSEE